MTGSPGPRVAKDGPGGDHQEPENEQEPPKRSCLAEHRRCGHHQKERGDCTVCQVEIVRRRPHTKLNALSVDFSWSHVSAHLPGDEAAKPRGKYFLICSITPLREDDRQACLDGARAKEPWVILQGRESGRQSGERRGQSDESRKRADKAVEP